MFLVAKWTHDMKGSRWIWIIVTEGPIKRKTFSQFIRHSIYNHC